MVFLCVFGLFTAAKANDTKDKKNRVNANDLEQILNRGTLRVIVPARLPYGFRLPRSESPILKQLSLVTKFSESLGLHPEIIPVSSFNDILPTLISGNGDIVVANLTITEQRKQKMAFSIPITHVNQVVLVPQSDLKTSITKDLANKSLLLNNATSYWKRGLDFKKRYPSIELVNQDSNLTDEDVINLIANKKYDATIRDSNVAKMYLSYRDDIRIAFNASGEQDIALGLRLNATKLQKALNKHLSLKNLETAHIKADFGDIAEIKKRGVLRVLLRNNASSYFIWRGKLMGFEYEMAQSFAKKLKVRLEVFVPKDDESAIEWLSKGRVDLAAGFLTKTTRWKDKKITASLAYHQAFPHIIIAKNSKPLNSIYDLHEQTVLLQKESTYWKQLEKMADYGINITLVEAPQNQEIEEIIQSVAAGKYPITIADEHFLDIEIANNTAVKSAFTFGDQVNHSLAIRSESVNLLKMINSYIKTEKDARLYTRLYDKYFLNPIQIKRHLTHHQRKLKGKKILSVYDELVQKYSDKYGFDWRIITAQMFQESRFDPNAKSRAGAIGLMQVMPSTGKQVGLPNIKKPSVNIHAGTKYMKWLYGKFDISLPSVDRMWFTLASYNAGLGHVIDARSLANKLGLDKDRWFENVEKAMLLLSKKKYANKSRFGYVRGREPVGYVRSIKKIYKNYLNIFPERDVYSMLNKPLLEDLIPSGNLPKAR